MGWSSAVRIFDDVCEAVLHEHSIPDECKTTIVMALAESLDDLDWDTQCDSMYAEHPIVQEVFYELYGWRCGEE